jgi:hypothetical protein
MFDCDKTAGPVKPQSASQVRIASIDSVNIAKTLSSVSYALFICGGTVLTIAAFLEPKQVVIPIIIGYSFILAGIAAFATYTIKIIMQTSATNATAYNATDKFRIGMVFFSLILITSITISIYSKYKSQIKSGNVPQFSTFSVLISLFICMQLYEMYKWIDANDKLNGQKILKVTSTLNSALLLYKLISYVLIICLTISLKYYVTDG